jgi:HlyD family secretion protein
MTALSTLQPLKAATPSSAQQALRLVRLGSWIVLGAILPICLWMAFAPLSMAVVAPGYVKVDLNRRPVQHLEGGIVRKVLVRDGQHVKAGQTVLVLGDVGVDADRNRLDYRVSTEQAAIARLNAEQELSNTLEFPAELQAAAAKDSRVAEALAKENALFMSRRDSLASEVSLMRMQRDRVHQEISALKSQISQAEEALALQRKELDASRRLLEEGYFSEAGYARLAATVTD